jgi:hypothetical protein
VIASIYPIDKTRNADALRRPRPAPDGPAAPPMTGVAPLLQAFLDEYRATGLPPAYQPKHDIPPEQEE